MNAALAFAQDPTEAAITQWVDKQLLQPALEEQFGAKCKGAENKAIKLRTLISFAGYNTFHGLQAKSLISFAGDQVLLNFSLDAVDPRMQTKGEAPLREESKKLILALQAKVNNLLGSINAERFPEDDDAKGWGVKITFNKTDFVEKILNEQKLGAGGAIGALACRTSTGSNAGR